MSNVYIEARPKGRDGDRIDHYVIEDERGSVLGTYKDQKDAIAFAKQLGHKPLVARVRHLSDKRIPDHWRHAE